MSAASRAAGEAFLGTGGSLPGLRGSPAYGRGMGGEAWFRIWPFLRGSDGLAERDRPFRGYSVAGRRRRRREALARRRRVFEVLRTVSGVLTGVRARVRTLSFPQSEREVAEWCGWLASAVRWLDSVLLSPRPCLRPVRRRWVHGLRPGIPGAVEALCSFRGSVEEFLKEWSGASVVADVLAS